ncbi:MAG TPA: serine/threonine-protein kinase [Myxococcaceae bacterium]|nr:serine/threonine-protein kinase [Myxococcaceae bacterium]
MDAQVSVDHPPHTGELGQLPAQFGPYTLLKKLDAGGMAQVYLAEKQGPEGFARTLVLKMIHPHLAERADFIQMLFNEARLAALVNHPNVVSIYELGEGTAKDLGRYYIAMEYLDGLNLLRFRRAHIRHLRTFPSPSLCAHVVAAACEGLHFAHTLTAQGRPLNIIHRDVSPENLFLTAEGMVKILDFGIAKAASLKGITLAGQVKGKIGYMAPEQMQGKPIDRRADVWSMGVTLYWLLAGHRPFRGDNEAEVLHRAMTMDPPPLATPHRPVPAGLEQIVLRALTKDPDRRYAGADEMQADLNEWIDRHGERTTRAELSSLVQSLSAAVAEAKSSGSAGSGEPGTPFRQGSRATPFTSATPRKSSVTPGRSPAASAPLWRRLASVALELLPALALWRFTYFRAPWAPSALLFGATALSLPLLGASAGQWALRLRLERGGRRAGFLRSLFRFGLCYAWLPLACAFLATAYASSPASTPLGLSAGALLVLWLASGLGALAPQRTGLFDQLLGTAVVRR